MFRLVVLTLFVANVAAMRKKQRGQALAEQTSVILDGNSSSCPANFSLPPLNQEACGQPVLGTLVVGCIGAFGLHNSDKYIFGQSDPFCRARLSDAAHLEKRGWYSKFKSVSSTLSTKTIKNELNPKWNEVFEFSVICPQHPAAKANDKFQLEVTIKDEDWIRSTQLGNIYIPLDDVLSHKVSGTHTFPLQQNLADANDTRPATGNVLLHLEWCPLGDEQCINKAREAAGGGRHQEALIDCDMACDHHMKTEVGKVISRALHALQIVNQDKEKIIEQDPRGFTYFSNQPADKWRRARQTLLRLEQNLTDVARNSCGPAVVHEVVGAWKLGLRHVDKLPEDKYDHALVLYWLRALWQLKEDVNKLSVCLESKWRGGEMLPVTSKLTPSCASYYASQPGTVSK